MTHLLVSISSSVSAERPGPQQPMVFFPDHFRGLEAGPLRPKYERFWLAAFLIDEARLRSGNSSVEQRLLSPSSLFAFCHLEGQDTSCLNDHALPIITKGIKKRLPNPKG